MNQDFSFLFDLIQPKEVAGRGIGLISRDVREKLAILARGGCNDQERRELMTLLEKQPDLLPALVDEIRALRQSQE